MKSTDYIINSVAWEYPDAAVWADKDIIVALCQELALLKAEVRTLQADIRQITGRKAYWEV